MKPARICVITGTRAEFGIWTPVLRAIRSSRKLRLQLVATGMHLLREFGHTVDDVVAERFEIAARVPMYRRGEPPANSLARGIRGMAAAFAKLKPDLVMVLGDRMEIFAAAGAAMACQIPLAHLHGGETAPAQWDEQIRHAVTKMAQVHFCATEAAGRRIQQMGEPLQSIHCVGAPAVDTAVAFFQSRYRHFQQNPRTANHAIVLLHPSSPKDILERERALLVLDSLSAAGVPFSIVGPNNDPGHRGILAAYRKAGEPVDMSMSQTDFWQHLVASSVLVGNSSSGIIEAASLGIPVINLGDRQKGRQRNPNVIDLPWPEKTEPIIRAVHRVLTDSKFLGQVAKRENLYGDGHASVRIVRGLEGLQFPLPVVKSFHDRAAIKF